MAMYKQLQQYFIYQNKIGVTFEKFKRGISHPYLFIRDQAYAGYDGEELEITYLVMVKI
ncbi:unnamed protein product [Paramecium pentaurelia]|uniref:Uncharacterized protein n=1 Tax=Paramecium pentaurelia TaxID=43138 RepID=A0A8S1TYL9_9CILI|nr:unnamed protein product [Paramecium pentaurelia]